jgi:hypothetical protein
MLQNPDPLDEMRLPGLIVLEHDHPLTEKTTRARIELLGKDRSAERCENIAGRLRDLIRGIISEQSLKPLPEA